MWTKDEVKTVYQYVLDLRERLDQTLSLAQQELTRSKEKYRVQYNKKSRKKDLKVSDKVLILLPTRTNKLLMQWHGSFLIVERVGDLDNQIWVRGELKTYNANIFKKFFVREGTVLLANGCAMIVDEEERLEQIGVTEEKR